MGFESLLGNERLKDNLRAGVGRGRTSHFYLISGPAGSGKKTLAKLLAAAILCRDSHNKPCMTCPACRKVMGGSHPDLITVADPEKKAVPVKLVREFREDMFIRPNEADKKIYLFPQELNVEGQNTLLKILEEPPVHLVCILLTDNPEMLLPTVRSRATELALQSLPDRLLRAELETIFPNTAADVLAAAIARSGGYLGQARQILEEGSNLQPQAEALIRSVCRKDVLLLAQTLQSMEKFDRERFINIMTQCLQIAQSALVCRAGGQGAWPMAAELGNARTAADLMRLVGVLQEAIHYARANVSVAAIGGDLLWRFR